MNTVTGTIKQLISRGLTFNGVVLDQPGLSLLTRIGEGNFATRVGSVPAESATGRGKPSTIWALSGSFNVTLATVDDSTPALVDESAASNESVADETASEGETQTAAESETASEEVEASAESEAVDEVVEQRTDDAPAADETDPMNASL